MFTLLFRIALEAGGAGTPPTTSAVRIMAATVWPSNAQGAAVWPQSPQAGDAWPANAQSATVWTEG